MNEKDYSQLPEGLVIAWYGDDFTGAAAVLEVLTFSGLPSVLFLDLPKQNDLQRFRDTRAIGVASTTRTMSPTEISSCLPGALSTLATFNSPLIHYKVCTTLDSSPTIGSIGHALEVGANTLGVHRIPILIAAPQMRRYQAFGQLYASYADRIYRLDRHPVMKSHPITPMSEADVALHLAKQALNTEFDVIDLEQLKQQDCTLQIYFEKSEAPLSALILDCIDEASEEIIGGLLWNERHQYPFVVGSQGIEYALVRYWQSQGLLAPAPELQSIGPAHQIAVVSGSVSKITAGQIQWARDNGFTCIQFDASIACEKSLSLINTEIERCFNLSLNALNSGSDPLIYTAEGPDDPAVRRFKNKLTTSTLDNQTINQRVGDALGQLLARLIEQTKLHRVVISGGDTSGHATKCLDIRALTALAPTTPGAPIFKAHSDSKMDGLEIALKGGQMGTDDYFGWVKQGGGLR